MAGLNEAGAVGAQNEHEPRLFIPKLGVSDEVRLCDISRGWVEQCFDVDAGQEGL